MKKELVLTVIICLLMILFVYSGSSKLLDMRGFRAGMMVQPLPAWMNKLMAGVLPFTEILIALALGFAKTRKAALYAYALLMLCFTGYTALVVFGFFAHRPCGCGGIIKRLSWEGHLIINVFFLLLTFVAIRLNSRINIFTGKQGVSRKPGRE